jgi:hypothetical protein
MEQGCRCAEKPMSPKIDCGSQVLELAVMSGNSATMLLLQIETTT